MTTNLNELKAGAEMDALIAEKVMGWTGKDNEFWTDSEGVITNWGTENCVTEYAEIFRPSSDDGIKSAWRVVEKISADESLDFRSFHLVRMGGGWMCSNSTDEGLGCCGEEIIATAPTAPEAICKAALMALGVE